MLCKTPITDTDAIKIQCIQYYTGRALRFPAQNIRDKHCMFVFYTHTHGFILYPSHSSIHCNVPPVIYCTITPHSALLFMYCCLWLVLLPWQVSGDTMKGCHSWMCTDKKQKRTNTRARTNVCLVDIGNSHGQHTVIWQCDCLAGRVFCSVQSTH